MSIASVVALLQAALLLLTIAQSSPSLPQSVRDNAQQVAQQAIAQATAALKNGTTPSNPNPTSASGSFDQSSLYATTEKDIGLITVTGTAQNVSAVSIALKGWDGGTSAVVNGRWSITLRLPIGSYGLELLDQDNNAVLAMGRLTVASPSQPAPLITTTAAKAEDAFEANLGGELDIEGNNLATVDSTHAYIGGYEASVTWTSDTEVRIIIPRDGLSIGQSYDLYIQNRNGTSNHVSIKIDGTVDQPSAPNPVVINSFTASPSFASPNQAVTLSWSSNAANCQVWREDSGSSTNISGLAGSASTYTVYPSITTTYTLHCYTTAQLASTGKDGPTAMKSVTVNVSYAAGLPQCPSDASAQRGNIGQTYQCSCVPGFTIKTVWGGPNYYSDNSDICTAGAQVGQMNSASGGEVDYTVAPGQSSYQSWSSYGITSQSSGSWLGSFQITGPKG